MVANVCHLSSYADGGVIALILGSIFGTGIVCGFLGWLAGRDW